MQHLDFEKRMRQRRRQIELRLATCDPLDPKQCQSLTLDAAREAQQTFMPERFGCFTGGGLSIVFSNMGSPGQFARDAFCRELDDLKVPKLAIVAWPPSKRASDRYTWAVAVQHPDGEHWCEIARRCWVRGGTLRL